MVLAWMPVVAALAGSASGQGGLALRPIEREIDAPPVLLIASALVMAAPTTAGGAAPPPCVGDVCQPRVAVPGYEPRVSVRGKRTELAANLLSRARLEPLATVSQFLVATGLRLDFTPAALDRSTPSNRHGGWGYVQLTLRWRTDAFGKPVWAVPR